MGKEGIAEVKSHTNWTGYDAYKKYGGALLLHVAYLDKIEGLQSPLSDEDFETVVEIAISPQWTVAASVYRAIVRKAWEPPKTDKQA